MNYKYTVLLLLIPFFNFSQIQVGQDINGEAVADSFGNSVSLSSDGSIVAIGAPYNDGNGSNSGHVRIYKHIIGGEWTQLGQDINGEAAGDLLGASVSLSSDGSIVAIGAPHNDGNGSNSGHVRIYKYVNGVWAQVGQDINGEAEGDSSGSSVRLSSDGSMIAIGAYGNDGNGSDSGHVRVYKKLSGVWVQVGQDINGEAAGDFSGTFVSITSDGSIVAIAAHRNDGDDIDSGHVRIYKNISGVWTQIGQDINGEAAGDGTGKPSLSSDGSIVAIGSLSTDANGVDSGQVRVYKNVSGVWTQLGQDIKGEAAGDFFGWSVSLSSDGSMVAIGAKGKDTNGDESGQVSVYKNVNGVWVKMGEDLYGKASSDFFGWSVSLSSNGNIVAIGAPANDGVNGGIDSGYVGVYDLTAVLSTESLNFDYFTYAPNPVKAILNINLNSGLTLKQVNIYTIEGKYLYSVKDTKIDVSNLASGMYFFEVETNQGKSTKKIVVD